MPRTARLDVPGILHHLIIRGIERREIFKDDEDRKNFLNRIEVLLPETGTICYAWVFMTNHAHFLFRSGDAGLPTLMRRLLTGYAVSYNRRHNRHGQLFQNRYKSIVCQEDAYLKELVRYIHLNPIRAGIISNLDELIQYPFCGHGVLMGKIKHEWQNTKYVLNYFNRTTRKSKNEYQLYVEQGIKQGRRDELVGGGLIRSLGGWDEIKKHRSEGMDRIKGDERILGDSNFVDEVLLLAKENYNKKFILRSKGYNLKKISQKVTEIFDIEPEEIFSKGRRKNQVESRSLLCYWAVFELGMKVTDLAGHLNMTVPGVGYSVQRGKNIAKKNGFNLVE